MCCPTKSSFVRNYSDNYIDIPIPDFLVPIFGLTCAPLPKQGETWLEFVVFMISQFGAFSILFRRELSYLYFPAPVIGSLALVRGFQQYRSTNNPLLTTMFHDGV